MTRLTKDQQTEQDSIIKHGNGVDAYWFACNVPGADVPALQQVVIERGDGEDAYLFACDVPGADIEALQRVVIERGDGEDLCNFASKVPSADIKALQQAVAECGDGEYAYMFACDVPGADIETMQRIVIEHGDGDNAYHFCHQTRVTSTKGENMGISINGVTIKGKNVRSLVINNGKVIINGEAMDTDDKVINIHIEGHVDMVDVDACDTLEIKGNASKVKTMSGDVYCNDVEGNIQTMSGDVSCDSVAGDISSMSGDIRCRKR